MSTVDAAIIKTIATNKWDIHMTDKYCEPFTTENGPIQWTREGDKIRVHTTEWTPSKNTLLRLKTTDGKIVIAQRFSSGTISDETGSINYHLLHFDDGFKKSLRIDEEDGSMVIYKNPATVPDHNDQFELPDNINTGIFKIKPQNPNTIGGFLINMHTIEQMN